MLFNIPSLIHFYSQYFIFFFICVFILYWIVNNKLKPFIILLASYIFYASWDYRFLILIIASTLIDFYCGKKIHSKKSPKKYLYLSIIFNLGILLTFKSYDFFIDEFIALLSIIGVKNFLPLKVILPLGISFYTFQTMTYTIDIYRSKLKPEESFFTFAAFVSFFPQLIAGPIERAGKLLPQIKNPCSLKEIQLEKGLYLIAYGFFKKRVIADFMAVYVEQAYQTNSTNLESLMGIIAFSIQIYCDVSGYAHMARGYAYLLGIELSKNFNLPFFSTSPSDFWAKWHITLSIWVRDYIYIPFIIRFKNPYIGTLISFIVMGAWLGFKGLNFVWGLYWAIAICLYQFLKNKKINHYFKNQVFNFCLMFIIITLGHNLFRALSFDMYIMTMAKAIEFTKHEFTLLGSNLKFFYLLGILLIYEIWQYSAKETREFRILSQHYFIKILFYLVLIFTYRNIGNIAESSFIYFNY